MSWSRGSELMGVIIQSVKLLDLHIPFKSKVLFYQTLIDAFQYLDCDTLHDCGGADDAFDVAYKNVTGHTMGRDYDG